MTIIVEHGENYDQPVKIKGNWGQYLVDTIVIIVTVIVMIVGIVVTDVIFNTNEV